MDRYVRTIDICMKDPEVDGTFIIFAPQDAAEPVELAEAVATIAKQAYKPVITTWMGTTSVRDGRDILTQNNIPQLPDAGGGDKDVYVHVQIRKDLPSSTRRRPSWRSIRPRPTTT